MIKMISGRLKNSMYNVCMCVRVCVWPSWCQQLTRSRPRCRQLLGATWPSRTARPRSCSTWPRSCRGSASEPLPLSLATERHQRHQQQQPQRFDSGLPRHSTTMHPPSSPRQTRLPPTTDRLQTLTNLFHDTNTFDLPLLAEDGEIARNITFIL